VKKKSVEEATSSAALQSFAPVHAKLKVIEPVFPVVGPLLSSTQDWD
jgi:hypothetical protein